MIEAIPRNCGIASHEKGRKVHTLKKHLATFVYAVLAGICIGLGGTVFLRVKDAFTGANIVGAILFGIGLFAICTRNCS